MDTPNFSRIVVGLSFQAEWLPLARTVAMLARAHGKPIQLVHVSAPDGRTEPGAAELARVERSWGERLVGWYADHGVDASMHWARGNAADQLLKVVEETDDPRGTVLALGASDLRSRTPGFVGSNTLRLLRAVRGPLLVVPWGATGPRVDGPPRLLYPTDFSRPSVAGLTQLGQLASLLNAEVRIVHLVQHARPVWLKVLEHPATEPGAGDLPAHLVPGPSEGVMSAAFDRIRALQVPHTGLVRREIVPHEYPAGGILEVAARDESELIVLPSHGRGALGSLLLGSVAEAVLRTADRPVLVIKP